MKLYLAGPMQGYPDFNFPAFKEYALLLRSQGHEVFSPAEKDEEMHGSDISKSETGSMAEANAKGFDLGEALRIDLTYICKEAQGIALMPGWENSKGAQAEWATARAMGLEMIYLPRRRV